MNDLHDAVAVCSALHWLQSSRPLCLTHQKTRKDSQRSEHSQKERIMLHQLAAPMHVHSAQAPFP